MQVEIREDTVFLKGFLDESVNFENLKNTLLKTQSSLSKGYLKINFSEVRMANSVGILNWLNIMESLNDVSVCYSMAPKWLIGQINMVPQFMRNKAVVESFEVPFYCEEKDTETIQLFVVGRDIIIKKEAYTVEDFNPIVKGEDEYLIDVLPKNYFRFINDNFQYFTEYFSK
jgi:hypothetical protein